MGDRVTGLGQTIDAYELMNGIVSITDAYKYMKDKEDGAQHLTCQMADLSIDNGSLLYKGDSISLLSDDGYEKLCKLLNIPTPYLLRLPHKMRKLNIEYWFDAMGDKEVSMTYKDGELLEIFDGWDIKITDIMGIFMDCMPQGSIFKVSNQANSTIFDMYDENIWFETEYDMYFGGIRLVHRKGLKAPDIVPIFLNANSCGIIECSTYLEKLSIKNLSYKDIMQVIRERVSNCLDALPHLFHMFESIAEQRILNPHRRIALYCREHNVPERVRSYALASYDESGLTDADFEVLIDLFSSLGYANEVKQASERKLQQLAGYIIIKAHGENRCDKCDSQINND